MVFFLCYFFLHCNYTCLIYSFFPSKLSIDNTKNSMKTMTTSNKILNYVQIFHIDENLFWSQNNKANEKWTWHCRIRRNPETFDCVPKNTLFKICNLNFFLIHLIAYIFVFCFRFYLHCLFIIYTLFSFGSNPKVHIILLF